MIKPRVIVTNEEQMALNVMTGNKAILFEIHIEMDILWNYIKTCN